MLYCFLFWTVSINMIICYINQGRKKKKGSNSVFIVFILIGKSAFAFLPPHTLNWGWIHSTQIWLIDGGLYFSSSWSYPLSILPSAQVKAVIEALQSQGLGWKMVHVPAIHLSWLSLLWAGGLEYRPPELLFSLRYSVICHPILPDVKAGCQNLLSVSIVICFPLVFPSVNQSLTNYQNN